MVLLSRAQSTAHTYFTGAVKSDVVLPIVVCWACLLQFFGAAKIGHLQGTRYLHGFPPLSLALGRLALWRSRWTPLLPAAGAQGATGLRRQTSGTPGCRGVPPLSSAT